MASPDDWLELAAAKQDAGDNAGAAQAMQMYRGALGAPPPKAEGVNAELVETAGGAVTGRNPRERRSAKPYYPDGVTASEYGRNMLIGGANTPLAAWHGAKQLVGGDVSEEDIRRDREIAELPGGGTGGFIASSLAGGPIVSKVAPLILKAAGALPKVMGIQTGAKALTYPALAGAQAGVTQATLGPDESRLKNILVAAGLTGALQVGGAGLRRAATGAVKPNQDAIDLMRSNYEPNVATGKEVKVSDFNTVPTISQGGAGKTGKILGAAEDIASILPLGIGSRVAAGRDRVKTEAANSWGDRVLPQPTHDVPLGRGEFGREMETQIKDAYAALYRNPNHPKGAPREIIPANTPSEQGATARVMQDANFSSIGPDAGPRLEKQFRSELRNIWPDRYKPMTAPEWQTKMEMINDQIKISENMTAANSANRPLLRGWIKAKEELDQIGLKMFNAGEIEYLRELQKKVIMRDTTEKALASSSQGKPGETLNNVINAFESNTPDKLKIKGEGYGQRLIEASKRVLAKENPSDVLGRRIGFTFANKILPWTANAALIGGAGLAGGPIGLAALAGTALAGHGGAKLLTSRGGAEFLYGQKKWQPKLADMMRKHNGTAAQVLGTQPREGLDDIQE